MIRKLRIKFIAAAMLSVFCVLVLILGTITLSNYRSMKNAADERIALIESNGGTFPVWQDYFRLFDFGRGGRLSEESPFDTRYFSVRLNAAGEPVAVNTGSIAAVDRQTALGLTADVLRSGRSSGFTFSYRYRVSDYINGKLIVFVDTSREMSSFRSFLKSSAAAGAIGLMLVFVLVFVFSKLAIRPVAESYEKQKRFITDASHEIKTPLAIINSANEVIEMETGGSEWTKSIANQVGRLSALTGRLVMLSRMDEENYVPHKETFDLSGVCDETARSFDAVAQARGRSFDVRIQPGVFYNGDADNIAQLISLLLDNAMKYSNENGVVTFTLRTAGKNKLLTVENTVDEIKKGNQNILFERFYRSDSSRSSQSGGSGIGLSVAKAIVTAHGGKISAVSPDGKNIVFTVTL